MKKPLAIGYRKSKSDNLVLKSLLAIGCMVVSVIGLVVLLALWNGLWRPEVKRDSAKLDSILAGQKIDAAEVISWEGTNAITGEELSKLLVSFNKTNRIANIDWTKQETKSLRLLSGTHEICWLSLGEDGAWEFGTYGFRTRR